MSGISAIGNTSSYSYAPMASGKRINTAADGAAELSIIEKEKAQVNGYDKGASNMQSGIEALNVADGALGTITDSLQRMKELSIQASNGLLTDGDRQNIQHEIDQLKQDISDTAKNTSYNTHKLLDGTDTEYGMATDATGNGTSFTTGDATLKALGIEDYDVTGSFDMSKLDDALEKVTSLRAKGGAQTNGMEYAINYNRNVAYNTTSAQSRIEDLDYGKAISDQKKHETLNSYKLMMQKKHQENQMNQMRNLFG